MEDLNDLVRELSLLKEKGYIVSRLQQWNLLQEGTIISHFRERHAILDTFYEMENNVCFCTDIHDLMKELRGEHKLDEWRLFIDASQASL